MKNKSKTHLAYLFKNFQMPDDAPYGEYFCALYWNSRKDCSYTMEDDIRDTTIHTNDGDVQIKYLRAEYFLMKYGEITQELNYLEKNKDFYYYEH